MPESLVFCCVNKLLAKNKQLDHSQCCPVCCAVLWTLLLCARALLPHLAGWIVWAAAGPFGKLARAWLLQSPSCQTHLLDQLIVYKLNHPLPVAHPGYTSLCLQAVNHREISHVRSHTGVISVLDCVWKWCSWALPGTVWIKIKKKLCTWE